MSMVYDHNVAEILYESTNLIKRKYIVNATKSIFVIPKDIKLQTQC